jgi:predicted transcriptional regulator
MTLAYMQNTNSATTIDLEKVARLRQPEVSIVIKQLKERYWINERGKKKVEKGRPNKIYSLKVGFADIIAQLEKKHRKTIELTFKRFNTCGSMIFLNRQFSLIF